MGKVVDIESKPRRKARAGRKKPSKTALVLGGGGFTGGVYEIGALRALDLLAVNSTVNNFDVYVGTSAGSFVAGMLANGDHPRRDDAGAQQAGPLRARGPRPRQGAQAQLPRLPRRRRRCCPCARWSCCARWPGSASSRRSTSASGWPRRCRPASTPGRGIADYVERRARRRRPRQRLPPARPRALPDRDRPRHLRADRLRRGGLGRRADLEGDRVLDRAADRLQAGRAEGPPARRRRHPLDHQRRHRGREGRQVHRRRQPARPLRQRLREDDPDDASATASAASPTWACRRSPTRPSA